ncbi:MAG: tape measure protein [Bryobacterales bacterium]|nr:tape measure protein [Bryobacterales bacterium]
MPNLKVGIVISAIDRATKPLRALSGAAGATGKALAKMGDQSAGWQERLARATGQARSQVGRLGRALDARLSRKRPAPRGGGRGGFLPGGAGGIVDSAVFAGGRAAMRLPVGFLETASKFENLEATLATIEGSAAKAEKSFEWVKRFTATTPYQLDQVAESFVKLRAYGIDPINGALQTLGDTASGMDKSLEQAVEALADARMGEYERLKEFAISARTTGDTVRFALGDETRTADKNSLEAIQAALLSLMEGKFGGGMEAKMKLFDGLVSNLADKWTEFQNLVMEAGPFEMVKDRLSGVLARINAMAASGELDELAERIGAGITDAFGKFERDVLPVLRDELWPALRDDIWPALKDIAGVIGEILQRVNNAVNAFGGWGVAVRGIAVLLAGKLTLGAGRMLGGGFGAIQDTYGGIKDAVTSDRAKRMRTGGGRLARSAFDIGKAGISKAGGGLARFGRTLASLALRFVPLLMGALKALAAVFAGISLPVTAAVAAIAAAAYLIWKHWEPIKGFFSRLWESVKAAFSGFREWLSSIDWSGLGARLMGTLAAGIRSAPGAAWNALRGGLGKLADLLPSSDARAGPLSRLSSSGAAILATMGDGIRRAGPGALSRPLAGALGTAAAGLALSIPASVTARPALHPPTALQERLQAAARPALQPESPAAPPSGQPAPQVSRTVHHHYRITIQQLPGEDAEELAGRVIRELERQQSLAGREALGDAY